MKKTKDIEKILKETGLISELVDNFSKILKIDKKLAEKIIQMRMNDVFSKIGKNIVSGNIDLSNKTSTTLSEMSNEDIINSDNVLKDK